MSLPFRKVVATASIVLAGLLMGCESSSTGSAQRPGTGGTAYGEPARPWRVAQPEAGRAPAPAPMVAKPAPAPAPAPVARPGPAPAPAPAPATGMVSGFLAYPTGDRATSALLVEKVQPAEVSAGKPFNYEIRVTNISKMELQGVAVTDTVTGMRVTDAAGGAASGDSIVVNVGKLGVGETKVYKMTAVADNSGTVTNCVSASYNALLCLQTNVVSPALKVVKQAPAEVLLCDPIPVQITVSNDGTGVTRNVVVSDNLPDGLVTADGQRSFTLNAGNLAAGESKNFTVNAKATRTGTFANTASAKADGDLTANSNETRTVVRQPVLAITKTGPASVFMGTNFTYDVVVTNNGDAPARDTVLTDTLPVGARVVSATDGGQVAGSGVTWNLGTLQPNDSRKVSLTVVSDSPTTVRNTATANAYCAEAVSAVAETRVTGIPAVLLEVVDEPDPVRVGDSHVYIVTVTNQGSAPITNAVISAAFDTEHSYVSATGDSAVARSAAKSVEFAPVASIAPKARVSYRIVAKADADGDARFAVTLKVAEFERTIEETEASNYYR